MDPGARALFRIGVGQPLSTHARDPRSWREASIWRHAVRALRQGGLYFFGFLVVPSVAGRRAGGLPHFREHAERAGGPLSWVWWASTLHRFPRFGGKDFARL